MGRDEAMECEEKGRRPKCRKPLPKIPKAEREMHELTHTPFRTWCKYCMKGRGQNQQHRSHKDEETSEVPRISLDYLFMSKEDERASSNPIIIMKNEGPGEIYARVVG